MNVGELLDELRENVLADISDEVRSSADGQLWSDATLVRNIADGQLQFAARTLCLRTESVPDLCDIQLVPGQEMYEMSPKIISVYGAKVFYPPEGVAPNLRTRIDHLDQVSYGTLMSSGRGDLLVGGSVHTVSGPGRSRPAVFYTDRETNRIGIHPAPSEAALLRLRVAHRPLRRLTANDLTAELEIPEEHHMDVLEHAAWRCLRNHDIDSEDIPKASTHKRAFEAAVEELRRTAKRTMAREIQFDNRPARYRG